MTTLRMWILVLSASGLAGQPGGLQVPLQYDDSDPDLPKLICRMAMFAQLSGDMPAGEKLSRHGLTLFAKNNALETPDGAACLTTLAGVLEWKGQPKLAQDQLEHALAIRERLLGPSHFLVADTLNRLGQANFHQGRIQEAEQLYSRALEILRPQAPSAEFAAALNNLGNALSAQGRSKEAEDRIRQAISMWETLGGPDDPSVAAGLTNLGGLLREHKQYDEAARLLSRALRIDERRLPANHPRIATDLNAAGVLAMERRQYQEAERLFVRSVAILEGALSPQHPETGQVVLNLAEVYRLQKKMDQARDAFKRGLATVTSVWGPNDPRLPLWMEKLALVLRVQEDFAGAEQLEVDATRIRFRRAVR